MAKGGTSGEGAPKLGWPQCIEQKVRVRFLDRLGGNRTGLCGLSSGIGRRLKILPAVLAAHEILLQCGKVLGQADETKLQ